MNRPRVKIRRTKTDVIIEIMSFLLILASALVILFFQSELPEKIEIPFNWPSKNDQGVADNSVLWMSPLISGIIITVLFLLTRIPHFFNYPVKVTEENAHALYQIAIQLLRSISITVGFLCITFTLLPILSAKGVDTSMLLIVPAFLILAILLILVVSVIRMVRVKSN